MPGCCLSIPRDSTGSAASPTSVTMMYSTKPPTLQSRSSPPLPSTGVIPAAGDLARTQSQSKQWTKYSRGQPGCSCRMHLPRPPR